MALITKKDFGQVEPNHLSAQRNGQIYAQLPCDESIKVLENGMFVKYDYARGACSFAADAVGEFMLVFNEVKLYDVKHSYKDFAYKVTDFTDGKMFPRVFKTMPGDLFTTNTFEADIELVVGDKLMVGTKGFLVKGTATAGQPSFQVAKVYTLADGQPAVKVQRIA